VICHNQLLLATGKRAVGKQQAYLENLILQPKLLRQFHRGMHLAPSDQQATSTSKNSRQQYNVYF
jgi:hypothetical protein